MTKWAALRSVLHPKKKKIDENYLIVFGRN